MEKVWGELKKIDSKAEQIREEAQLSSDEIKGLAKRQAEKLLADSQKYAEDEAQHLLESAVSEANRSRKEQMITNIEAKERLVQQADKQMKKASLAIFNAIIGET